jgi:hypothetical protein
MKRALSLLALLLASTSHAAIQGNWYGWGEWKYEGSGMKCMDVTLSFNENATKLTRTAGHFGCDLLTLDLPTLNLEKIGSQLILGQSVAGSFTDAHYQWSEAYSPKVRIDVSIDRSANHLDYTEIWIDSSGAQIYQIQARLFLRESNH